MGGAYEGSWKGRGGSRKEGLDERVGTAVWGRRGLDGGRGGGESEKEEGGKGRERKGGGRRGTGYAVIKKIKGTMVSLKKEGRGGGGFWGTPCPRRRVEVGGSRGGDGSGERRGKRGGGSRGGVRGGRRGQEQGDRRR